LCTYSTVITGCIQHQSFEMHELCDHLINQQRTTPMNLINILIKDFRTVLNNLHTSFDSKINYLSDIHFSTIDKLNAKHQAEIDEMKCEMKLTCNGRT